MKNLEKNFIFLIVGFFVFFAGCAGGPKSQEQIAEDIVHKTDEGSFAYDLKTNLNLHPSCTKGEYESKIATFAPLLQSYNISLAADTSKIMENTKLCNPKIIENVKSLGNERYVVSYRIESSARCPVENIKSITKESYLDIEADLALENSKILKGQFKEEEKNLVQKLRLFMPLAGNCLAPLLISTDYLTKITGKKTTVNLQCKKDDECIVDLSSCKEHEKAAAWKDKKALVGEIMLAGYLNRSGLVCNVKSVVQSWPLEEVKSWWCGKVVSCSTPYSYKPANRTTVTPANYKVTTEKTPTGNQSSNRSAK